MALLVLLFYLEEPDDYGKGIVLILVVNLAEERAADNPRKSNLVRPKTTPRYRKGVHD